MSKIENEANAAEKTTRNRSLFYKRIYCVYCGKGMKKKVEKNTIRYCCSEYDNYKRCRRTTVDEDFLIELLKKRFEVEVDRNLIEKYVEKIYVEDKCLLEILIKDQESILLSRKHLRY